MRTISLILFILALPILAVIGHDLYVTYQDQDFSKAMMLSDVGYLWRNYAPGAFEWAENNIDKSTWSGLIVPVLEQTAAVVAAIPFLLTLAIAMLLKAIEGSGSFKGTKRKSFSFGSGENKKGRFTYKRK